MHEMNLHNLRCLDALLEERSVSRAAERLEISQPAMSMALKRLRRLFDDPLLVRGKSGLTPTEKGQALRPSVRQAIRDLQQMTQIHVEFDPRSSRREFTLILTDYIDVILVPRLVELIQSIGADITIHVVGPNPFRIGSLFAEGQVDLTVSYFPGAPGNLKSRTVFFDRMVAVVRRDHPALAAPMTVDAFCALNFISVEPGEATMYRAVIDEAFRKAGRSRRVVLSKPEFLGVPFVVSQSDLVAIMPSRLAALFTKSFDLAVFDPPIEIDRIEIKMMWHESTHHSAPHQWLRDQTITVCKTLPDAGAIPPSRDGGTASLAVE